MALSNDLVRQFAKITNDNNKTTNSESTVYGTVVSDNGSFYVKIDGSDLLTPVETTTSMKPGERVMVQIKNHLATVTGNLSDPAASAGQVEGFQGEVDKVASQISEFEIVIAHRVTVDEINAINATISNLKAITAKFTDMEVVNAEIDKLLARYAELEYVKADDLEAINAIIENLEAEFGKFDHLTADDLTAITAEITNLKSYNGDFTYVSADVLTAIKADIKELDAEKASVKDLEVKYANIDFANITEAAIEKLFSESGIIRDIIVSEGKITGELVGVTIKGDLIEAGTLKADRLVVKGSDGKYYKLNTDFAAMPGVEPLEEDMIHGSSIVANSITAEKIAVDDLVAFDATIGGFHIGAHSLYSGVKSSATNTTRGVFLGDDGQVAFGDGSNFLRYFKDQNGNYKLEIQANSILFGASGKNVETVMSDAILKVDVEYANSTSETTAPTSGWSTNAPGWESGKYMWQRTATTYGDDRIVYSDPVCITGATGQTGKDGSIGKDGNDGVGVDSIIEQYYQSTSYNSLSGGSWVNTVPDWIDGKYIWTRSVITYTNGTAKTTDAICVTGSKGATGATGATGKGVLKTEVLYYRSTSNTTQVDGAWITTPPEWIDGMYYWQKIRTTFTDNTTNESDPVCITGGKGADGIAGETGKGVASIVTEFYLSTSKTTQTGDSWRTTMPTWQSGRYLWTRSVITYTNPTSIEYTTPICDSSWEAVNNVEIGGRNLIRNSKTLLFEKYYFEQRVSSVISVEYNGYGDVTLHGDTLIAIYDGNGDVTLSDTSLEAIYDDGNVTLMT